MFKKTSNVEVLGVSTIGKMQSWQKVASGKYASAFMDGGSNINIEAALDTVADIYKISRNPEDYLFIPTRANSANRPNENLDGWQHQELLRFDEHVGRRVYQTYIMKPHFVNHNASSPALSRGVIIDSHFNDINAANDDVKRVVYASTGEERQQDEFVETLIAVDTTKDPALTEAYKNGSVYRFSMGCDVEATKCSIIDCGNIATAKSQFCDHIRMKHARKPVRCSDGQDRIAFEWCVGTIFTEESAVDDPADKTAEIQEGLLKIASSGVSLSNEEKNQIVSFVVENSGKITEPVAKILKEALSR